jgi:hypothetical protein
LSFVLVLVFAGRALGSTLTGHLTSASGPVATGFVAATGPDGQAGAVSDASGAFSLTLPDGTYRLAADAPGFTATVMDGVTVSGASTQDLMLTASGAKLTPMPVFGGGRNEVAADGTSGVFYAMGGGPGQLYRTVDYGGTWTQVTVSHDDPTNGLSEATNPDQVITSGFPGEVAVDDPAGVFYSTDYGVTWSEMSRPGPGSMYWGHVGTQSVLLWVEPAPEYAMYVADMTAASPSFVQMTTPYAPSGQPIAVGDGGDQSWLATVDSSGQLSVYPLEAQAEAPAATITLSGFPTDPIAVGIGGARAGGEPPSGIIVQSATQVAMTIKAPADTGYPAPATDTFACTPWHPGSLAPGLITANTDASYGAASLGNCWVQDSGGTLAVSDAYGNGIQAIDAGYNATESSPGTDAVVLLPAFEPRGPLKLASVGSSGDPRLPDPSTADTANAGPGTEASSAGISANGITAPSPLDATLGPTGASQVAVAAQDIGGVASDEGGASFQFVTYEPSVSAAWWQGATGAWLLFGASADYPNLNGVSGVENWTEAMPAVSNDNVSGSDPTSLGLPNTQWVYAIAGVPGSDTAFLGTGQALYFGAPETLEGALTRVSVGSGPSFSDATQIGVGVITSPVLSLAYCPTAGSASSLQDVALAMTGDQSTVSIYRVTGATGPDPVATKIMDLSSAAQDKVAIQADCASGTVLAGSGAASNGLLESTDGGQTFNQLPITISGQTASLGITAVAITPGQPTSILAAGDGSVGSESGQGWIVSSGDGGQTWTVENDPTTQQNFAGPGVRNLLATPFPTSSDTRMSLSFASAMFSADPLAAGTDLVAGVGEFRGELAVPPSNTSQPSNTSPPTISGAVVQGQTLTETHGSWTNNPTSYSYQWEDCDSSGNACSVISGATGQSYTLASSDVGHTIRVTETASNAGGPSVPASSAQTGVVQQPAVTPTKPSEQTLPVITGTITVGQSLGASTGTWSGTTPISFTEQWERCRSSCSNITRATGTTYTLVAADLGARVRVVVTASNSVGSAQASSSEVGPVAPSAAQIKASLLGEITPHGKAAKIASLLKNHGYVLSFTALIGGKVVIDWYYLPNGAHLASGKPKPVLVAAGKATFARAGRLKITIDLTANGKRLLKHAKQLALTSKDTFTPTARHAVVATKKFMLTGGP